MREPVPRYLRANQRFWEEMTPLHVQGDYYRRKRERLLRREPVIDAPALAALGDFRGKSVLQPCCHLGYETLSLVLLGAGRAVGRDFNSCSVAHAAGLAREMELPECRFEVADAGEAREAAGERFDLIFFSYGSLCWLPDLRRVFTAQARLLTPGGSVVIADFHPMLFCFDFLQAAQPMHTRFDDESKPIAISRFGSYAVPGHVARTLSFNWNHSLEAVRDSLRGAGLAVQAAGEFPFLPEQNGFTGLVPGEDGYYRTVAGGPDIPLMFTLKATRHDSQNQGTAYRDGLEDQRNPPAPQPGARPGFLAVPGV